MDIVFNSTLFFGVEQYFVYDSFLHCQEASGAWHLSSRGRQSLPGKRAPQTFPSECADAQWGEGALLVWLRLIQQKDPLLENVHVADGAVCVAGMVILFRSTLLDRVSGVKCALKGRCCISIASFEADRQSSLRFPQSSWCSPCLQTVNKCQCVLRTDVCCSVLGSEITFPGPAHSFPLDHKSGSRQVNHQSRQGDNLSRAEPALCGSTPSKTSLTQSSRPEERTHWSSCTLSVQPRHTQGC